MSSWTPPMLTPGAGNPCRTRMKVFRDNGYYDQRCRWRVFEIAQPGQRVSHHEDRLFRSWGAAMAYANRCVAEDRPLCEQLIDWMSRR